MKAICTGCGARGEVRRDGFYWVFLCRHCGKTTKAAMLSTILRILRSEVEAEKPMERTTDNFGYPIPTPEEALILDKAKEIDNLVLGIFCREVGIRGPTGVTGRNNKEWTISYLRSAANMLERINAEEIAKNEAL